jgi:hypothetical protein
LRPHLFFGEHTVHAQLAKSGDTDAVHRGTLVA